MNQDKNEALDFNQNACGAPVPVAAQQTANWRNYINTNIADGQLPVYGFYIPLADIEQLIKYADGGFRVYLALKNPNAIADIHIYTVALDSQGNDIILINGESAVYDTSQPCPPCCGAPSPMNS